MKNIDEIDAGLAKYEADLFRPADNVSTVQDAYETTLSLLMDCVLPDGDTPHATSATELDNALLKPVGKVTSWRDAIDAALKDDATNQRLLSMFARARRVACVLYAGRNVCMLLQRIRDDALVRDNVEAPDFQSACGLSSSVDGGDVNKFQQFVLYLLNTASKRGYARHGNVVYERIRDSHTGISTCAWKPVVTILQFVYDVTNRAVNFDQWVNLTSSPGNAANAATFLEHCNDELFPALEIDRHVIAFADGIYVTKKDAFYPHDEVPDEYKRNKATAQYFDVPFPFSQRGADFEALGADDISTPCMQSILDFQEFAPDVSRWMYAFLGRMLYQVGEKDNWQVMPFLLGMAQSGKSTVLMNVVAKFFDTNYVGVMSNNVEKKFGLSGFSDKFLFIAPEVNEGLCVDQAEFQSLVSGDMMQIAKKHETSRMVEWKVPGILAGNQVPGWKDTAGSIVRRIAVFRFVKSVVDADTSLPKRLHAEVPSCIVKCNKAYLAAVKLCKTSGIWKCLPDYFLDTQRELQKRVNPIVDYLSSDSVVRGPTHYMPWKEFMSNFTQYCKENGLPIVTKNQADTYVQALGSMGCRKTESESRKWQGINQRFVWLVGATLKIYCEEASADEE